MCEKINIEFKEFYLNSVPFSERECKKIINSGVLPNKFYEYCNEILQSQIKKYIPKYISSFNNSKIHGTIYFGVKDNGIYSGIPHNNLSIDIIRNMINECKNLVSNPTLIDALKIEIVKLDKFNDLSEKNKIKHFINKCNDIDCFKQMKFFDHMSKRLKILHQISKYRSKIIDVVNKTALRNECIKYIKNNCRTSRCRINFIKELKKRQIDLTPNNIHAHKKNKKHVMHWITTFRDCKTSEHVSKLKKLLNWKKVDFQNPYSNICRDMKKLKCFCNADFYIIKISNVLLFDKVLVTDETKIINFERVLNENGMPVTYRCEVRGDKVGA